MLIGKQVDAIWHTGIVVFNKEYYFGKGICYDSINNTPFGKPIKMMDLGETKLTEKQFYAGLDEKLKKFNKNTYDVITNNCNHFSEACT